MQSQSFPVLSPLTEQQQPSVESLNQLIDPISFLTDTEMQQDLDFFANTQFSYDVPPAPVAMNDHCWNNESCPTTGAPYCYDPTTSNIGPGGEKYNDGGIGSGNYSISSEVSTSSSTSTVITPAASITGGEEDDDRLGHHLTVSTTTSQPPQQKLSKDDKRKRNTAASARFRVKKKLREQALQRTAYEMTEKSKRLEAHIQDLEREIKWLKALVVEKSEGRLEQLVNERPMPTVQYSPTCAYQPPSSHLQDDDNENDLY
ncbi:hypothetical protein BDA99DRAFT_143207 [Phascolomyces articulosus]|uniref:BZIP domain-containing protein n=1 Tax=Phascolomyces articulosus TaxID=60185 RepID=A0AAD5PC46_9FUNG|nr:hypothetical protein BDA99DRAFT_143207 [Phascolomyces articulosus]